jgi:NAD(P)-dependent dehydrogenase (short-subunit alcohol dehydrogenase family)
MKVAKKVVLIAGAGGGVGYALAEKCIDRGYRVALLYRTTPEQTPALNSSTYVCDITDIRAVERTVADIIKTFGRIDVCVQAAADVIVRKRIVEMNDGEFRSQFEANVFGAFNVFTAVAAQMQKQGHGTLVGITSDVIEQNGGGSRMGAYTTAKGALRMLLRELHREVSGGGIRVFAVAPGLMRTKLTADLPEKYFEFAEMHANKPLMTPDHVAHSILALMDSDASGISYLISNGERSPL